MGQVHCGIRQIGLLSLLPYNDHMHVSRRTKSSPKCSRRWLHIELHIFHTEWMCILLPGCWMNKIHVISPYVMWVGISWSMGYVMFFSALTHLPLVPHICVNELCQHWSKRWLVACTTPSHWFNQCYRSLSIEPLGTILSEILIKIRNFSFMKMHLKISSAKWRPFCPG